MKNLLYPRLALTGIMKNKKLYLPYFFTCTGMSAMFYVITALCESDMLKTIPHNDTVITVLGFGSWMTGIFSLIFLYYTNSFLVRRRNTEFGLYNILGMSKRNIGCVVLCETFITAVTSMLAGAVAGILFSKAAQLVLLNMTKVKISYDFTVSVSALLKGAVCFGAIHTVILISSLRKIRATNPTELLHSEMLGEKPPKGNAFAAILGAVMLCVSYTLAITVKQPISALLIFFFAVIMVIIGTYLLFISGSVFLCRLLKKNKKYYYKPQHFISVSSMAYRMKRNGAGLASICILVTMVLVMITGSGCLYFGAEDALNARYPRDVVISADYDGTAESLGNIREFESVIAKNTAESGIDESDRFTYAYAGIAGVLSADGRFEPDPEVFGMTMIPVDLRQLYFIELADYNTMCSCSETLGDNEAFVFGVHCECDFKELTYKSGFKLNIVKKLREINIDGSIASNVTPSVVFVVKNIEKAIADFSELTDMTGDKMMTYSWIYAFDTDSSPEMTEKAAEKISASLDVAKRFESIKIRTETLEENRSDFYSTFGGLFFLGIMLSTLFILAAVLIIYYKQVCEGYEDKNRFNIMQKVGMTKSDIKKSINSQLLTVFFLPPGFAVLHLAFAFPIIRRLLMLFHLTNVPLLIGTACVCTAVFAVFYTAVYKITSKVYYNIVS